MDILKKLDLTLPQLLKAAGIVIVALLLLIFVSSLFSSGFGLNSARNKSVSSPTSMGVSPSEYYADDSDGASLSMRNVVGESMPIPPDGNSRYVPGVDAEDFEVKEYRGVIETNDSERDCSAIHALKGRDDVIFERANEGEEGCGYTFKVANKSVENVLSIIESLDPKELTETAYTIKRQIDDYTSEVEILETKLATINATLASAEEQYDNITALATRIQDVESLAKIINSKLTIIERLTEQKIQTAAALERISRQKAEQLDRLVYTYFSIDIYESKYINGADLKNSWKRAVQLFVYDTNKTIQDMTVGLIALILIILKYLIYFMIVLFVVRFLWGFTKKVWKQDTTPTQTPNQDGGMQ